VLKCVQTTIIEAACDLSDFPDAVSISNETDAGYDDSPKTDPSGMWCSVACGRSPSTLAVPTLNRFIGSTALVTGGASGLGAAVCRRLTAEGAAVIVADVDEAKAALLIEELRSTGSTATITHVDLSRSDGCAGLGEAVAASGVEALDVLVNNAGIARRTPIDGAHEEHWDALLAINLRAPALVTRALLPLLRARCRDRQCFFGRRLPRPVPAGGSMRQPRRRSAR
jgi:NAD(P)-dependent dehydrogenase (short-subunit alcohol dehydrogenase family)